MSYQLTTCKYKYNQNQAIQEFKLIELESMKSLLVTQYWYSGESTVELTNWGKNRKSDNPIKLLNTKGFSLKEILKAAGIDEKMLSSIPNEKTLVSHSPPFHADDLMACVLMGKYYESKGMPYSITLTRDQKLIDQADAAVDVGSVHSPENLRFDHHQLKDSKKAATGLVADFLKDKEGFDWLTQLMPTIQKIDDADLGKPKAPQDLSLSEILGNFNPTWREKQNNQFFQALTILEETLESALELYQSNPSASLNEIFESNLNKHPEIIKRGKQVEGDIIEGRSQFIRAAIEGQHSRVANTKQGIDFYLLFTQEYLSLAPDQEAKALKAIDYITFETPTGAFNAIAAPTPENRMAQKNPFPQDWRGKRGQELVDAISKSTGGNFPPVLQEKTNEYFCHNAGFFLTLPSVHKDTFDKALSYCAKTAQRLGSLKTKIGKLRTNSFENQRQKIISKKEDKLQTRDAWGRGGPM